MFLMETHLDEYPAECLRRRLKMDHKYVVRSDGQTGGLIMYGKKEVPVSLRHKTKNFIDVFIGSGVDNFWRLIGMYGEPKWKDKHLTWQRLKDLYSICDMPWMVIGDLNEIMYSSHFMSAFRDAMEECNLSDLGYTGDRFTWHRGLIRERLDRAISNDKWNDMFPAA